MHRFRPKAMAAENITASSKNNHLPRTLHSEKTIFLLCAAKKCKIRAKKVFLTLDRMSAHCYTGFTNELYRNLSNTYLIKEISS